MHKLVLCDHVGPVMEQRCKKVINTLSEKCLTLPQYMGGAASLGNGK